MSPGSNIERISLLNDFHSDLNSKADGRILLCGKIIFIKMEEDEKVDIVYNFMKDCKIEEAQNLNNEEFVAHL